MSVDKSLLDHPVVQRVRQNLRIQKVVATRSVKGRNGDHYVGFSAAWDSTQDDAGGGGGLISTQEEETEKPSQSGMSLQEARVASILLGLQADISAHKNAFAGGNASTDQLNTAIRAIKVNYGNLLMEELKLDGVQVDHDNTDDAKTDIRSV